MKQIVFVGGIHGVGKTVFTRALCADTDWIHKTASSLIKASTENKRVKNIRGNQTELIAAVNALEPGKYLLDGHFCLCNADGQIRQIDTGVFAQLSLCAIVALQEAPALIRQRIYDRDKRQISLKFLLDFQEKELQHAQRVANSLGVPVRVISPSKADDKLVVANFLEEILS